MSRIRKGDEVVVLSGKDKGKHGKVISVNPKEKTILVEKINIIKRHTRPTEKNKQGGIIEKPAPFAQCKVMLICQKTGKPSRVKFKKLSDGSKIRIASVSGEEI